eukprot:TRINITY_DN3043_c0_g1_i1.p1 TRINITY_DN3043_c0_g1~~TRINITY_DN3043_c0_g1_i1.p1  ORF type:complete len:648 (-),score=135.17 TRINITY_DN3043_c0_g1_i1:62-2005(-)
MEFTTCLYNDTALHCDVTTKLDNPEISVMVAVYNPGDSDVSHLKIKVPSFPLTVLDLWNRQVRSDVLCENPVPTPFTNPNDCTLFFSDLIARYSWKFYRLVRNDTAGNVLRRKVLRDNITIRVDENTEFGAKTDLLNFTFRHCAGSQSLDDSCEARSFSLYYKYYNSYQRIFAQNSGAYILRTANKRSFIYSRLERGYYYEGKTMVVFRIVRRDVETNLRVYRGFGHKGVEIETFLKRVSYSDRVGKEVTINFYAHGFRTNGVFYTDANGLKMIRRERRPKLKELVGGNYYPVTSAIYLKDEKLNKRLVVLSDRAQGGSSLNEAEMELMIQRRLLADDRRGVDEALDERDNDNQYMGIIVRMTHFLLFTDGDDTYNLQRQQQLAMDNPHLIFLAESQRTDFDTLTKPQFRRMKILKDLNLTAPADVKLHWRPYIGKEVIFRAQNMNEREQRKVSVKEGGFAEYAGRAIVGPEGAPNPKEIEVVELSLSANQRKTEMLDGRYHWTNEAQGQAGNVSNTLKQGWIVLNPMEIRTFSFRLRDLSNVAEGDEVDFTVDDDDDETEGGEDEDQMREREKEGTYLYSLQLWIKTEKPLEHVVIIHIRFVMNKLQFRFLVLMLNDSHAHITREFLIFKARVLMDNEMILSLIHI